MNETAASNVKPGAGGSYRLLACDLDGTLIASHGSVSACAAEALQSVRHAGVIVVVSTGRALAMVPKRLRRLRSVDALITSNGARVVLHNGTTLSTKPIPNAAALETLDWLKSQGAAVNMFYNGKALFDRSALCVIAGLHQHASFRQIMMMLVFFRHSRTTRGIRRLLRKKESVVEKIGGFFPDEASAGRALETLLQKNDLTAVTTGGKDIEITAAGVDKGDALQGLCRHFGFDRSQIVVCGDSGNDLSMRAHCGLFVAPRNASKDVLAVADVITDGAEKDGIAIWLLQNLK